MENYIKLQKELLQRKDIKPNEKLVIAFIQSYQINNLYYFGGEPELSKELGMVLKTLKRTIKSLEEKKIIFKSQEDKYIKHTFNNRNAIILVDDNNPYPTSNELSNESDSLIPKEIKQSVKTKKKDIEEKQVEKKHSQQYLDEINNKQD
jgi:hypothetical protein